MKCQQCPKFRQTLSGMWGICQYGGKKNNIRFPDDECMFEKKMACPAGTGQAVQNVACTKLCA